jgi:trk system potassium uptake protein TrkA
MIPQYRHTAEGGDHRMNIFIAGAGRVGFHVARLLSAENHDVTVIETDPTRVEQVDYTLDVSTAVGNASSVILLKELGVAEADLFVAASGIDEINLISAATAKGLGAKQVVARVDNPAYVEGNILYEALLGIDYILSPDALTAVEVVKYIETPGMVAAEDFGRGLVQVRQMRITKSLTSGGRTLKDIVLPPGVLIGTISRDGDIMIARGDSTVERGDLITLIGKREQMEAAQRLFQGEQPKPKHVIIMGGARIGLHLAQILQTREFPVKLIDWNEERCNSLAAKLQQTKVVCRDATARITLEQEHVAGANTFVATTSDDERNIMASVLANEVGAEQTIAIVHQPDFASLVGKLGIDHAVTPRASIANRILRLVHQKTMSASIALEEGQVQVVEFVVRADAVISGKQLKEIKFPKGALAAMILRKDEVIVPSGNADIQAEDSIIVIAVPDSLESVQKLFLR